MIYRSVLTGLMLLCMIDVIVFAEDVSITAYVDSTSITQDDTLVYTLEVKGSSNIEPQLPDFSDFQVVGGPSTSSSIQIVNNQISSSKTYTFQLLPLKAGALKIPPASVTAKGKQYQSQSFTIQVSAGTAPPPAQQQPQPGGQNPPDQGGSDAAPDDNAYVTVSAKADKDTAYIGEQINVEYQLVTGVNIANLNFQSLPGTSSFWVEDMGSPQRLTTHQRVINGREYAEALLKRLALFPTMSGEQTIEPMVLNLVIRVPRQRQPGQRNRTSRFPDPFGNDPFADFFGGSLEEQKNIIRRSAALPIQVLPLPEQGKPADFKGTVGDYTIRAELDKNQVPRGQAVTLRLVITGNGNIKTIAEPNKPDLDNFRLYEPKSEERSWIEGNIFKGEKKYEYVMIPKVEGEVTIPAIPYSFFSPSQKRYVQLTTQPLRLVVTPGNEEDEQASYVVGKIDKKDIVIQSKDIRYIKSTTGVLRAQVYLLEGSQLPLLFLLPLIVLPGVYLYSKQREKLSADVSYARFKQALPLARKYLKTAEKALKHKDAKAFYDALSEALVGFIAYKLDKPKPGLTLDVLMDIFKEKKVPEDLQQQFRQLLMEADLARFTPAGINSETMKKSFDTAQEWLHNIIKGKYLDSKK